MTRAALVPLLLALSLGLPLAGPATAQETVAVADMAPRAGWNMRPSPHDFDTLVARLDAAVAANGMAVVTRAGPTAAAAARGIDIPGNMVVGVFNNDFAVRILGASTAAMIHAPIRFYVTENADGTASLSHVPPSAILAPYLDEGGEVLAQAAAELDARFAAIAEAAVAR